MKSILIPILLAFAPVNRICGGDPPPSLETQLVDVRAQLATAAGQVTSLTAERDTARTELTTTTAALTAATTRATTAESGLATANQNNALIITERDGLRTENQRHVAELAQLRDRVGTIPGLASAEAARIVAEITGKPVTSTVTTTAQPAAPGAPTEVKGMARVVASIHKVFAGAAAPAAQA